jgi:hypothetical protein
MTRTFTPALGAVVLLGMVTRHAHAQQSEALLEQPRQRQGYYLALGGHGALAIVDDEGDSLGPLSGYMTTIRLGQKLTPKAGLGLAIDFGGASSGGDSIGFFGLALAGELELVENLALHASMGLGIVTLTRADDKDELAGTYGAAYTLGLSYDWFLGKKRSGGTALTPFVQLRALPGDVGAFTGFLGVEIAWWSGLPRNQLELPTSDAYK